MPISVQTQAPHTTSPLARDIPMHARESAPRSSGGHPLTSSSSITYVNGSSGIRGSSEPVAGGGGGRSSEVMSGAESSVGAGGEKPKKGKKKGWKGWALVVEDEEGNVIEVRDRGESPSGHRELSPEFSREGSAAAVSEHTGVKRLHKSLSPRNMQPATKDSIYDAPVGRKAEEPKATAQPVPKRRRHNSPSSGSPQPSRDPGPSVAPRPANTKPAKPRPSVPTAAPIRTTTAAVREEAKRSRPATPTRLDGPTLTQAPRVGMGEVYPPPPESDIRKEAQYIIDAAARHRERERQRSRELPFHDEKVNGRARNTPPPTGDPAYPYPPYPMNGHSNGQRLLTTNGGRASLHYATAGPSSYTVQPGSRPSTATESHTKPPSYPQPVDDSFEEEYAAVQSSYDKLAEANIASMEESIPHSRPIMAQDEPRQPHFHEEQRPTIVLAPNGGGKAKIRDKVERAHQEGYEGLTPEHVVDAFGFVENVRDNLRNIILHYFPQPCARRDAFLERVGRGLADLGWQLTDTSDAAIL